MNDALQVLNSDRPATIREVEHFLHRLDIALQTTTLNNLHFFTEVYRIITANVQSAVIRNEFRDISFLHNFDSRFLSYYLDALEQYLTGRSTPAAWRIAFERAVTPLTTPAMNLALGVNAHIVNDIPRVLYECGATRAHKKDYDRVNKIIRRSLRQSIMVLPPSHRLLDPKRLLWRLPAYTTMAVLSWHWRYVAWRNYRRLSAAKIRPQDITLRAANHARWLQRLPF